MATRKTRRNLTAKKARGQAKRAASRRRAESTATSRKTAASSSLRAARRSRAETAASSRRTAAPSSLRAATPREGNPRGSRAASPIAAASSSLSTIRVVWRPAIAMATLPYRVYRVYRWAEAESNRSSGAGSHASA
jgi:hypothetical protein